MPTDSRRWLLILAVCLLLSACGRRYPEIGPKAYEVGRTVYNVTSLKRSEQLPQVRSLIDNERSSGGLTSREQDVLLGIVAIAEQGDWDRARRESRRLLGDQVKE